MQEDKIFPSNWKEIIGEKKVIFYNTSVSSLLQGREKQMEKMKWVFQVFQKHPEVVLWWRPHPLEASTIKAMAPELEQKYMEMKGQYKNENIGILDESADLYRAIAISDAYYGDWSSVVALYKAVKKPVLFENAKVMKQEETIFLPAAFCRKDEYIWFIQLNSNKLIKIHQDTFEVEDIINISSELPFKNCGYNYHIMDIGNSIFIFLEESENIYEYEIAARSIKTHSLKKMNAKFHSEIVIRKSDRLLLFPYGGDEIWEYDYKKDICDVTARMDCKAMKAAKCFEILGTKLYMINSGCNIVYKYDLDRNLFEKIEVGNKQDKFWGIKKAGKYFVLPHLDRSAVTLWNEENGEVVELADFPQGYVCLNGSAHLDMFENNGSIYIFPFYANMILKVDVENKAITQEFESVYFDANYDLSTGCCSSQMYMYAQKHDNYILAYAIYSQCWQIFDFDAMKVESSHLFTIKNPAHKVIIENMIDNECKESFCAGETPLICNLENYINNIENYESESVGYGGGSQNIGVNIHEFIMNQQ